MRRIYLALTVISGIGALVWAADWAGPGAQRDSWARGESTITKENAKDLQLLWKLKIDNRSRGSDALTSGVVLGRQITYRGFKEMLIVGGSSDTLVNIDADLGRLIWQTRFDYHGTRSAPKNPECSGALTAAPTMPPPPMRGGAARGSSAAPTPPSGRGLLGRGVAGFGALQRIWLVSSDGMLHTINSHTGADIEPPLAFVPPNARVDSLNISNDILYATTSWSCGGAPNGLYVIHLADDSKQANSFLTNGRIGLTQGGAAVGADGTVYVQAIDGNGRVVEKYKYTVLALSPQDLQVKDYFIPDGEPNPQILGSPNVTPVIFLYKGRELIVAAGPEGRLNLLDSKSLGGADHKTPLHRGEPIQIGIAGNFASWEDESTGTRWIYVANRSAQNGAIAAFKVVEQNGHPELLPAWISGNMLSPGPPVVINGTVFVLSTGNATHATLHVLDAETGKELYSSGNAVGSTTHNGGLAVANGRVYFGTDDNYLYSFGFPIEH